MTYVAELDDTRQVVRKADASGTIVFWPKVAGVGNVQVTGSPTYSLFKRQSTESFASGSITPTLVESVHKLIVPVDASALDFDENLRAEISWVYSSVTRKKVLYFDVGRDDSNPGLDVGLNDLVEEDATIEDRLTRHAKKIKSDRTAIQHASVLAVKAWNTVRSWLRRDLAGGGRIIPRLLVDHELIRPAIVLETMAMVYRAEGRGPGTEAFERGEKLSEMAQGVVSGLPTLDYDSSEDGAPDALIGGWSVQKAGRSW